VIHDSALLIVVCLTVVPSTGCLSSGLERVENRLVYQPTKQSVFSLHPPVAPPAGVEDVCIGKPESNAHLHGWYAEAKNPRAVVLYCHGNGGDVTRCKDSILAFRNQLNVTILAFDYSGYGSSSGRPSEATLYRDARLARKWLAERAGVSEQAIVLCGYSLGGGVAVELASSDGARALILERTFTTIPDVAETMVPWLPVQKLMANRFDSMSKIAKYHGPLLQTHGDADRVVPYILGQRLHVAANEPKLFVRIPGGGHDDPPHRDYLKELDLFFDSLNAEKK
jgi:fermentation-respiration switch protein FrsA (DUF1100 family)